MLVWMRGLARGGEVANEREHFDDDVAVIVDEAGKGATDDDLAAELLEEFADERGFGEFAGFDFAAGEFPFQREVLVDGTLGDEHATGGVLQDGADDWDGRKRRHGGGAGYGRHTRE